MVLGESLPKILNDSLPIVSWSLIKVITLTFELIVSNDGHCCYTHNRLDLAASR